MMTGEKRTKGKTEVEFLRRQTLYITHLEDSVEQSILDELSSNPKATGTVIAVKKEFQDAAMTLLQNVLKYDAVPSETNQAKDDTLYVEVTVSW